MKGSIFKERNHVRPNISTTCVIGDLDEKIDFQGVIHVRPDVTYDFIPRNISRRVRCHVTFIDFTSSKMSCHVEFHVT